MTDPSVPSEPLPFRVLLDEAMKLTRRHFGKLYLPVAIPLAIFTGLMTIVQVTTLSDFMGGGMGPRSATMALRGCSVFLVTMSFWMIARGLASGVLTAAALDGADNRPIDMKSNWGFLLQPSTLGTLLLAFLAVLVGLCFLLIPGIYIGLRLALVLPVMASEGLRGTSALSRSWNLVRYNPHKRFLANTVTKIFLLYVVAGLIGYAISFVVQLPFTAVQGVRMARVLSSGQTAPPTFAPDFWLQIPSAVLTSLVSTAVAVYTSFGIVLLYFDCVRRKEGGDLASAIDARFGAPDPAPPPSGSAPA